MKKIFKNGLYMLVAGALVASCADYNTTDDFAAEPDPTVTQPYKDLGPVKSYIDRVANPNLEIGATLDIKEFNKQELAHAAIMTNFDNVSFGKSLMSSSIISDKGVMNFLSLNDLLSHMDEIGGTVFGSPIVANANQADDWLKMLTDPIEIAVDYVEGKKINYNEVSSFTGTIESGSATIDKSLGENVLKIGGRANVNIIEDFDVDPTCKYTITIWMYGAEQKADYTFNCIFAGNKLEGDQKDGRFTLVPGKWTKKVIEGQSAEDVTNGYFKIENDRNSGLYIRSVDVGYYPDNHRPQTVEEKNDTIKYALNAWCDGLMKINKGRIKSFDLIDEPIDVDAIHESGFYDLKHSSTTKIFWQDILGSENYAPAVAKVAREAFVKWEGNADELKFFISEIGLEDTKKMDALNYWIGIWDQNGAKIDGINAKVSLVCYEDPAKAADNKQQYETLLDNLAKTGKLVRVSNFDITFVDAEGTDVATNKLTEEQRQLIADYNAYAIKAYMSKIPSEKQAGICKGSLVDSAKEPVGLWTQDPKTKDWSRNATYKAWCEALSGK